MMQKLKLYFLRGVVLLIAGIIIGWIAMTVFGFSMAGITSFDAVFSLGIGIIALIIMLIINGWVATKTVKDWVKG